MGEKAATNEVIRKLVALMDSDSSQYISGTAVNALQNILSSSAAVTQLDPNIISYLCLSEYGYCLQNISEDQVLNLFFTTKNHDWLTAVTRLTLLKGLTILTTEDKVLIYAKKEPLELVIPSLELRQRLIEAFIKQAKQLHLSFEILSEFRNQS